METLNGPGSLLRAKELHPSIAEAALPRIDAGFCDDAVAVAFKVVEMKMRELVGPAEGTTAQVIAEAWNPTTGKLHDPRATQSERESIFFLFRGAFGRFRNPLSHRIVGINGSQAIDQIVLANQLLGFVEAAVYLLAPVGDDGECPDQETNVASATPFHPKYGRDDYERPVQAMLDVTHDGIPDLVLLTNHLAESPLVVVDGATGLQVPVDAERSVMPGYESVTAVDVDNDGLTELVVGGSWDFDQGLVIYKFVDGCFRFLKKSVPSDWNLPEGDGREAFVMAHITDFDRDGQVEVVEEPWESVPEDLLPNDQAASYGWGRVRYVWKWDTQLSGFVPVARELVRLGPRF